MNARTSGITVDIAVFVSLFNAKLRRERVEDDLREIIATEDRDQALAMALYALSRLTRNEPERLTWALGLDAELERFVDEKGWTE